MYFYPAIEFLFDFQFFKIVLEVFKDNISYKIWCKMHFTYFVLNKNSVRRIVDCSIKLSLEFEILPTFKSKYNNYMKQIDFRTIFFFLQIRTQYFRGSKKLMQQNHTDIVLQNIFRHIVCLSKSKITFHAMQIWKLGRTGV